MVDADRRLLFPNQTPIAADMGDLITIGYAQNISPAAAAAPAPMVAAVISAVSARVIQYCRRDFLPNRYVELYDAPRSGELILRQTPVLSLNAVTLMPTGPDPLSFSATEFDLRPMVGRIIFRPGMVGMFGPAPGFWERWPTAGADAIEVDYTAGFGFVVNAEGPIAAGEGTVEVDATAGVNVAGPWQLAVGDSLLVDAGLSSQETVVVAAVTGNSFTATFALAHAAGPMLGSMVPLDVQLATALMTANVINQADLTKARESQGRTVGYEYVVRPGDLFLTPEVQNLLMPWRDPVV
ncbi:MAG: hypothetical protein ACP5O1_11540 [Phycisphaerae bacterium]